jgi:ABC-type lipoprotein release transport system permease subunit|tara:strand:- start:1718 stop:2155 length:438 start_codon:yes stop_codon:yes gene_type:complete
LYKKYHTFEVNEENPYLAQAKEFGIKLLDNNFAKRALASFQNMQEKIMQQSKLLKNIIFLCGISVCLIFLFSLVSTFVNITTEDKTKESSKNKLQSAKTYLSLASENLNNMDVFELHVKEAEKIIAEIESQKMFLNDIDKIQDEI